MQFPGITQAWKARSKVQSVPAVWALFKLNINHSPCKWFIPCETWRHPVRFLPAGLALLFALRCSGENISFMHSSPCNRTSRPLPGFHTSLAWNWGSPGFPDRQTDSMQQVPLTPHGRSSHRKSLNSCDGKYTGTESSILCRWSHLKIVSEEQEKTQETWSTQWSAEGSSGCSQGKNSKTEGEGERGVESRTLTVTARGHWWPLAFPVHNGFYGMYINLLRCGQGKSTELRARSLQSYSISFLNQPKASGLSWPQAPHLLKMGTVILKSYLWQLWQEPNEIGEEKLLER